MYNSRVKQRRKKKLLKDILSLLKFKTSNFSKARRMAFIGVITGFISLFINWINNDILSDSIGVFNKITGFTGLILSLIFIFILFIIFSTNKKEKLKLLTNTSFKDNNLIINLGIIIILLSLNALYTVSGLIIFSANISYGKGITLSLISGIVIIISGIILKNELSENENLILNDSEKYKEQKDSKDNMKLPF